VREIELCAGLRTRKDVMTACPGNFAILEVGLSSSGKIVFFGESVEASIAGDCPST
jgi:hypothetical protein